MARSTHKRAPEEAQEDIRRRLTLFLPPEMLHFLEVEAKRLTLQRGKHVHPSDILRALATSYFEKRMAGLILSPDD